MCIIFGKANRIANTQILVAHDGEHQLLMYSNRVELGDDDHDDDDDGEKKKPKAETKSKNKGKKPTEARAVMLLPFPCTDASQVNVTEMQTALEEHGEGMMKACHEAMEEAKPKRKGRGAFSFGGESLSFGAKKSLEVHRAGSYLYSLATTVDELPLVNQDLLPLPDEIFAACRALYPSGYMFAVCGLVPSAKQYKPFCMRFPLPAGGRLFVPTVHIHPHHHATSDKPQAALGYSAAASDDEEEQDTDADADGDTDMIVDQDKGDKKAKGRKNTKKRTLSDAGDSKSEVIKRTKRTTLESNVPATTSDFDHEIYVIVPGRFADHTTTLAFLPRHDHKHAGSKPLPVLIDQVQYRHLRMPPKVLDCLVRHAKLRLDAHAHMLAAEMKDRQFFNSDMTMICASTGGTLPTVPVPVPVTEKPAATTYASVAAFSFSDAGISKPGVGDSKSGASSAADAAAPAPVYGIQWPNVRCDVCNECPLLGPRWRCVHPNCIQLDLCTKCATRTKAEKSNAFWPVAKHSWELAPKEIHEMDHHPELQPLM